MSQEIQTPCWQSMSTFKRLNYLSLSHSLSIKQLKKTKTNIQTKKPNHPYDAMCISQRWLSRNLPAVLISVMGLLNWSWQKGQWPLHLNLPVNELRIPQRTRMGTIDRRAGLSVQGSTSLPPHLCLLLLVEYKLCLPSQGINCAFLYQHKVSDPHEQFPWWCTLNIA